MPGALTVWVQCRACEDMFQVSKGSAADREKLCNPCAEHRDRDPDEE